MGFRSELVQREMMPIFLVILVPEYFTQYKSLTSFPVDLSAASIPSVRESATMP